MTHSTVNVFADCSFPKAFSLSYLVYGMIITCFFLNFYVQSYINKRRQSDVLKKQASNGIANGKTNKHD